MYKVSKADPTIRRIVDATYPSYRGRRITLRAVTEHRVWDFWDGGSRNYTQFLDLATMRTCSSAALPDDLRQKQGNWFNVPISNGPIPMTPGIAVVLHHISCGKDAGVTIKVHPDNLARLLPTRTQS